MIRRYYPAFAKYDPHALLFIIMFFQTDNRLRLGAVLLVAAFANLWFHLVRGTVSYPYLVRYFRTLSHARLNDYRRMKSFIFAKQKIMLKGIGMFGTPK